MITSDLSLNFTISCSFHIIHYCASISHSFISCRLLAFQAIAPYQQALQQAHLFMQILRLATVSVLQVDREASRLWQVY